MAHVVQKHETKPGHYYVDGVLVAGALNEEDAIRIYHEAHNVPDA